jgi:hypothetical protein
LADNINQLLRAVTIRVIPQGAVLARAGNFLSLFLVFEIVSD